MGHNEEVIDLMNAKLKEENQEFREGVVFLNSKLVELEKEVERLKKIAFDHAIGKNNLQSQLTEANKRLGDWNKLGHDILTTGIGSSEFRRIEALRALEAVKFYKVITESGPGATKWPNPKEGGGE